MMGGLQKSDLVILACCPGMGKTALATNIAYNVAQLEGKTEVDGRMVTTNGGQVGFFSLEMSAEQLATRIISEQTEIPSYRIRRGEIDPPAFDRIAEKAREMETIPLYIDETGGLSIAQLAARARRLKRQRGLDPPVIDYIQLLLQGSSRRASENRVQEVTEITTKLKALAKELNVPDLALATRARSSTATTSGRSSRTCAKSRLDRAGRRRGDVRVPRGILPRTRSRARARRNTRSGRSR